MSDDRDAPGDLVPAEPPTGAELMRMRREELVDADAVAEMMERTAGLAAPAAAATGDLLPNEAGWRLAEGSPAMRLHPRLSWWAARSGGFAALGPTWATLLGAHHSLVASITLGIIPVLLIFGAVHLAARKTLAPLRRAPLAERLAEIPSGTTVRVEGTILSAATVPTLFRGEPAVLFKSIIGGAQATQGIDFDLDLGDQRARVCVRQAMLLDRAARTREPPACGPVSVDAWTSPGKPRLVSDLISGPSLASRIFGGWRRWEASVGPGDRIEVCGVLHHEADPESQAPFARQMPTRAVMRAGNKLPLLVRRLG